MEVEVKTKTLLWVTNVLLSLVVAGVVAYVALLMEAQLWWLYALIGFGVEALIIWRVQRS